MSKIKKVAILQSNYIPWKGYFDIINSVDEFVFYDTAQFTKNDWRNRNLIKTEKGLLWLTVPVNKKKLSQTIAETEVSNTLWSKKHWKSLCHNYKRAPFFSRYKDIFEELYLSKVMRNTMLSEINFIFICTICEILDINTRLHFSSDFKLVAGKSDRLLGLCKDLKVNTYVSGPSAKGYLDTKIFKEAKIEIEWMDYSNYPMYNQLFAPPFEHGVTILDLIFNMGDNAGKYMKSFGYC